MSAIRRACVCAAVLVAALAPCARAAWVKPNKKPVTAWQGFQDSANGAVTTVLPWNWFGRGDDRPTGYAPGYVRRRN